MIEAVLLDVGGVLVLPEPDVILPAVHAAGAVDATAADLARGHYAGIAAMDRTALHRGVSVDWPGYYRAVAAELAVPPAARTAGRITSGSGRTRTPPTSRRTASIMGVPAPP